MHREETKEDSGFSRENPKNPYSHSELPTQPLTTSPRDESSNITIEEIVDLPEPSAPRISPSGTHILYTVSPFGRKHSTPQRSIWLAEFNKPNSARQITTGKYNDHGIQWSPAENGLFAFISNRDSSDGEDISANAIYLMRIDGGEAYPITSTTARAEINILKWSPDGKLIAYTSADEESAEKKTRNEKRDDVRVYGEDWKYARLRVVHVATQKTSVIFDEAAHVADFTWRLDGSGLICAVTDTPELDSSYDQGTKVVEIGLTIAEANVNVESKHSVLDVPGPVSSLAWRRREGRTKLVFQTGYTVNSCATAQALYEADLKSGKFAVIAHGKEDDVTFGSINPLHGGGLSLGVDKGLGSLLYVLDGNELYSADQFIDGHDVVVDDDGKFRLVVITSTVGIPPEVYSKTSTDATLIKLSEHGTSISSRMSATFTPLHCDSFDGEVILDGFWISPNTSSSEITSTQPRPALLYLHGGPYGRVTNTYASSFSTRWLPAILAQGTYGVLSVNYRGSCGRGDAFAGYARGRMGTIEYEDVLSIVEKAIALKLVDPERLVVGGWSQGGFLSYLSAVRNGATTLPDGRPKEWRIQGAICGAGITDWDMMSMSSDVPAFESELVGSTPWGTTTKSAVSSRRGSPIWEFANAAKEKSIPPVLILHGEKDVRVPVSQAVAFHRGCLKWGVPCEFAVYPREPHGVGEREHVIDLLKRVVRFLDRRTG